MPGKRKGSKGRILRNGEVQRRGGMYMSRYTDQDRKRKAVYSWKLVSTDRVPDGKKCVMALRDIERHIQRGLGDGIRAGGANPITPQLLFWPLESVSPLVHRVHMNMIQDLGPKASTAQSVHSILYQICESAVRDHLIHVNPAANILKVCVRCCRLNRRSVTP